VRAINGEDIYPIIFKRKSVRKFEAAPLDEAALQKIRTFLTTLRPLFPEIRTELKFMGADEVKGIFKVNAPHYLAIYSEEKDGYLANAGFLLQQVDLFLPTLNIGSCWQGGPRPTKEFKGADGLEFVILLAFGRPAEELFRNSVSEFKRNPLTSITNISGEDELLEAVRLAPSAVNKQTWYFTRTGDAIHVYAGRGGLIPPQRLKAIDAGIAMCHLWLAAENSGRKAEAVVKDPGSTGAPRDYDYIASMIVK
jgi:nitroreductase